jgi:hypothetical protein
MPTVGTGEVALDSLNFVSDVLTPPAGYEPVTWEKGPTYTDPNDPEEVNTVADMAGWVKIVPLFADDETPSGTVNGSNVTFTLAHTPNPSASLQLFVNGQLMTPGATEDFTLSTATITFATAPDTGSNIRAWYRYV